MDNTLTNEEKMFIINNRLNILNAEIDIVKSEMAFYKKEGLTEKIEVSLNKLSDIPLMIKALQDEIVRLTQ